MSAARPTRRRYWNERRLGLWDRLYLPQVFGGLLITGGVFLRNMGTWLSGRKGALTTYYPEERRADYSPINRGRHVLTLRAGDQVQCVACNMCATVCPAYCIEIEAAATDDPAHPKAPARFEIDYARCIFCGFCVEACPEDAIRMDKDTPDLPAFERERMWGRIDLLTQWKPMRDPRKPYPAATPPNEVRR
ncbi:MAG: 4Fe-4S dicluster domain-containing protein [Betaproteobacteria bacterium]